MFYENLHILFMDDIQKAKNSYGNKAGVSAIVVALFLFLTHLPIFGALFFISLSPYIFILSLINFINKGRSLLDIYQLGIPGNTYLIKFFISI